MKSGQYIKTQVDGIWRTAKLLKDDGCVFHASAVIDGQLVKKWLFREYCEDILTPKEKIEAAGFWRRNVSNRTMNNVSKVTLGNFSTVVHNSDGTYHVIGAYSDDYSEPAMYGYAVINDPEELLTHELIDQATYDQYVMELEREIDPAIDSLFMTNLTSMVIDLTQKLGADVARKYIDDIISPLVAIKE